MEIKPISRIPKVDSASIEGVGVEKQAPFIPSLPEGKPIHQCQFVKGELIVNGQNLADLLKNAETQSMPFLSQLARDLDELRNRVIKNRLRGKKRKFGDSLDLDNLEELDPSGELANLSALVDAYVSKIMRLIRKRYETTSDGLNYTLDENGQLVLNGLNITTLLKTIQTYPTVKAKTFLSGIKNRLILLTTKKSGTSGFDKIREIVTSLLQQIEMESKRIVEKEKILGNS